jgi:extracellular elastinolytic metalloproteinase
MSREIDARDVRLQNVVNTDPEKRTGLEAPKDFFVQRALEHLHTIGEAAGLAATQPAEFAADYQFQRSTSGSVAVHLYQLYKNIPIFQATQTVIFAPDGSLQQTAGNSTPIAGDLEVSAKISVDTAVLLAARHVAQPDPDEELVTDQFGQPLEVTRLDLTGFKPKVIAAFPNLSEQPTVLEPGPFDSAIKAALIWFPMASGVRLCWEIVFTMPRQKGQFRTIVDSETGSILYCAQLLQFIAARGNVFRGNAAGQRQIVSFPLPLGEYGLPIPSDLPTGFPDDWVSATEADGNSVRAVLDPTGNSIAGTLQNGVVVFSPADPFGDDQKVLNLFFYACYMHDFFYLLGFREKDGNFQQDGFNRGGIGQDRLNARADPGVVYATANMNTPPDGLVPVMNMGVIVETQRHTAFDATVVFHEFMHGVTNRLVGGPMNNHALEAPQSRAMGEGWGDYIGCTLNNTTVVGAWVVNDPTGIRGFAYDSNFPDHFGTMGTGRYMESHNVGEIWCAALTEMNRRIGAQLALQLVVDALKLSPATPNFLDMRDAILVALDHKLAAGQLSKAAYADALSGIWGAFSKFGMGKGARANGVAFSGNVADFTMQVPGPDPSAPTTRAQAAPNLPIPDKNPVGVTSTLTISQIGRIKAFRLSVDIQHTFIGDLQIGVVAPDGTTFLLQTPSADSSQNLVTSYTPDNTSALTAVLGKQAQGIWTLKVADLVRLSVGTLRQWSLEMELDAGGGVTPTPRQAHAEAVPNVPIPDKDPTGISSVVTIGSNGSVVALTVSVDLIHEFIGDLQISLTAPGGAKVILLSPSMDPRQNLNRSFSPTDTPVLSAFLGQSGQGNWSLRVADLVRLSVGTLRKWSLDIALS